MTQPIRQRRSLWLVVAVLLVVTAAGTLWAMLRGPDVEEEIASGEVDRMRTALMSLDEDTLESEKGRDLSKLTFETLREMPVEDMMDLWNREDLTDEQRRQLGANMRRVFMNNMADVAERLEAAQTPEEKNAILDEQIDNFVTFRERMREYQDSRREEMTEEELDAEREERRERWRNPSREDREQRQMDQDPDRQAQMMNMFFQMQRRAQERGIEMGFGPGGRRGGPGGDEEGGRRGPRGGGRGPGGPDR